MAAEHSLPYDTAGRLHCDRCGEALSYSIDPAVLAGDTLSSRDYWRGCYTLYAHYRVAHRDTFRHINKEDRAKILRERAAEVASR